MQANPEHPPVRDFFGMLSAEVDSAIKVFGWPKFRGKQLLDWVYSKGVVDASGMTNFSHHDRAVIPRLFQFATGTITKQQISEDGTIKLLITWPGGSNAETVMIPDGDRRTACVSSQVGCPVRCKFCASGMDGLKSSLGAAQIVEQIWHLNEVLAKTQSVDQAKAAQPCVPAARVTNVVFMGMGEPLSNYNQVMQAVRNMHDPQCFNLGARRITISTVGVPPKIRQLAEELLPLNLALSLHAPNEPLRKQLIPWAEHFPLPEILDACRYYFSKTGREITLEYILLSNVNDRPEHARELARLCKTLRANVNLIRYNEVEPLPFKRPGSKNVVAFQDILRNMGVNAHVRKSRGRDIDAACGQLRRKEARESLVQLGTGG